jgi:hypothetical protein
MITHFQAVMGGGRRPYLPHSYDLIGMQWARATDRVGKGYQPPLRARGTSREVAAALNRLVVPGTVSGLY